MSLTLLVDMDDTLLSNPLKSFMPAYLQSLGDALSFKVDPARMIPQLLKATDKMIAKDDFMRTLEAEFDDSFYPVLAIEKKELIDKIIDFYAGEYLNLRRFTRTQPDAIDLINFAFANSYTVAIATNPLFPLMAMQSRLEWADLPLEKYPFSLVTSFETFHFAKPNPAYYAEILAQLGWPEQPVCMIGNSLSDDILPAAKLGMPTYWITDKQINTDELPANGSGGPLALARRWVEKIANRTQPSEAPSFEGLLAILKSTPAALDTLLKQIDETKFSQRPAEDEWSILEIICHLRDVEREINLPRFQQILVEENPFIPGIDSDRWASEREYHKDNLIRSLQIFTETRLRVIDLIKSLSPDSLNNSVNHSIFGPTTILELIRFITQHDQNHLRQIQKTIKSN